MMKYHTVKGHRLEVKKALSKEDLQSSGGGGGGGMRGGNYQHHLVALPLSVLLPCERVEPNFKVSVEMMSASVRMQIDRIDVNFLTLYLWASLFPGKTVKHNIFCWVNLCHHVLIVTCPMCVWVSVVLEVCVSHGLYVVSIGMRGGRGGGGGGRGKNIGFVSKLLFSCAALYILCSPHFSKLRCAFRQKFWRDLRYLVRQTHPSS